MMYRGSSVEKGCISRVEFGGRRTFKFDTVTLGWSEMGMYALNVIVDADNAKDEGGG